MNDELQQRESAGQQAAVIDWHCPECGADLHPRAGVSAYKHALVCFHLPAEPTERIRRGLAGNGTLYAERVRYVLGLADREYAGQL